MYLLIMFVIFLSLILFNMRVKQLIYVLLRKGYGFLKKCYYYKISIKNIYYCLDYRYQNFMEMDDNLSLSSLSKSVFFL